MKKIVSITIGKRVFSIEEDAYSHLQKYLMDIGEHFKKEDSSGEIISDIEDSISEKLITKKRSLQNAVTANDVDEVISQLGTIEELTDGEESSESQTGEGEAEKKHPKTLYRNGEDKVIAGVASGIANYFGIDPVIVRVLFFVSIFANGLGILIYIVLWIIVPQAKTASQKLAMRGEATNLESLEKFFETKSKKKINKTLIGKALSLPVILIDFVMRFLRKVFPVLRVLLGMITTFFASVFIFALVTLFLGILNGGSVFDMDPDFRIIFDEVMQMEHISFIVSSAFLAIFIPLFFLLLVGFYLILKRKMMGGVVFLLLFITWMTSISYLTISALENVSYIEEIGETMGKHMEETPDSEIIIESEIEALLEELTIESEKSIVISDKSGDDSVTTLDLSGAEFTGNGTEPFWGFTASGSNLILMEPSNTGLMNTTNFSGLAMSSSGTSINITSTELNVDLVLSSCSDGMSDIIYDYTSSLTTGVKNYSGCGNVN